MVNPFTYLGAQGAAAFMQCQASNAQKKVQAFAQQQAMENSRVNVMYGYSALRDEWMSRPSKFPRSREERIRRMERFMEWKREQRRIRTCRRGLSVIGWVIATPLVIAAASYAWRFAVAAIVS